MPDAPVAPVADSPWSGKKTYTAIATVLVGMLLKRYAAHLPQGSQDLVGPLVDALADAMQVGGAAVAVWARSVAKAKP